MDVQDALALAVPASRVADNPGRDEPSDHRRDRHRGRRTASIGKDVRSLRTPPGGRGTNPSLQSRARAGAGVASGTSGRADGRQIREPVEATASHMAAVPHLSAKLALREYIDHYQRMIPLADHVVVADFDEIVSDFGQVVERVNAHFDVTLEPFEPTQENVDAVSRAMDDHWAQVHAGRGRDSWQPRPNNESRRERPSCAGRSRLRRWPRPEPRHGRCMRRYGGPPAAGRPAFGPAPGWTALIRVGRSDSAGVFDPWRYP